MLRTVDTTIKRDFTILKSDELYIGGYASIEIVDKQNDLITLEALGEAVKKYMSDPKYRNVMSNHSNVQVGEVVKEYREQSGRLWKTAVDDVGFFVVIKLRDDIEKAKEVGREIRKGSLRSFSIGGQALEKRKRNNKNLGDYNEISKLELHEVTICEKGINPEAKFDILKQDVSEVTNIENALNELNTLLKQIKKDYDPDAAEGRLIQEGLKNPKFGLRPDELRDSGSPDETTSLSDDERAEQMAQYDEDRVAAHNRENLAFDEDPLTGELTEIETQENEEDSNMTENDEEIETEEYMDSSDEEVELKGKPDLPTGYLESGEDGEVIVEGGKPRNKHQQITVPSGSNPTDVGKSTWNGETHGLDLTHENLEKAYAQFKAEQMEKLAYEDIKHSFQSRLNSELQVKKTNTERNSYDAQAEVSELKKQFGELLDTLKGDAEMTIAKQEKVISDLNIPSYDDISKMDWNEIHLTMQRLEERR
tara:strand:+ start:1255 stop:2691 length:1437 start_codon:yes stop_codon:yes gene_type:complete